VSVTDFPFEAFVEILDQFGQAGLLFDMLKAESSFKELVISSLGFMLYKPAAKELFVGDTSVERLEFVFRELDNSKEDHERLKQLFSQIPKDPTLAENLMKKSFEPAAANLYLLILETSDERQESFKEWCIAGLQAVDSDTWRQHFYSSDRLLNLAFYLKEFAELNLGEKYFQGLASELESKIEPAWAFPPLHKNLASLIGPLESQFRCDFQDKIRAVIKDAVELRPWLLDVVEPELLAQLNSSRGLQVIEVFELILDREERIGLEWLDKTLETLGPSLREKYSSTATWDDLRQAARRAVMAHRFNLETRPFATKIANFFQVKSLKNGMIAFEAVDGGRIVGFAAGTPEELTLTEHPGLNYPNVGQPSWSPDGQKIAFIGTTRDSRDDIFVVDQTSGNINQITKGPGNNRQPSWSPDGKSLAFTRVDGPGSEIFTIDIKTQRETQLTADREQAEHPSWSPDGRRIVYQVKDRDNRRSVIIIINADGSNWRSRYLGSDPSWAPHGHLIAIVLQTTERGICVINPDDGEPKLVVKGDVYNPEWSPDCTKLLYQLGADSNARIFEIDTDGENKKELGKGVYPSWQPVLSDGPEIDSEPTAQSS
jgi:hypothetical protein